MGSLVSCPFNDRNVRERVSILYNPYSKVVCLSGVGRTVMNGDNETGKKGQRSLVLWVVLTNIPFFLIKLDFLPVIIYLSKGICKTWLYGGLCLQNHRHSSRSKNRLSTSRLTEC